MKLVRRIGITAAVATLALLASLGSAAPTLTVVMSGLDNPRGLAFGPDGGLYVAEAGRANGTGTGSGFTAAVTRLRRGIQERVATGLPSRLFPPANIIGANDITFQGLGGAYVTVGLGADPALRPTLGPPGLGHLAKLRPGGRWTYEEDIAAYEAAVNPDANTLDSNPYGILALPGERLVADAGANAVLRVGANGEISTLAVLPTRPTRDRDAVPTCVAVGPDGAYYIGELTGVPFTPGAANVYRVVPGEAPQVYLPGFTQVIDLAFGPDGSLYVLQHGSAPFFGGSGALIRVAPDGTRTTLITGLLRPTGVALGDDGAFYISNKGTSMGVGEVLRLEL